MIKEERVPPLLMGSLTLRVGSLAHMSPASASSSIAYCLLAIASPLNAEHAENAEKGRERNTEITERRQRSRRGMG